MRWLLPMFFFFASLAWNGEKVVKTAAEWREHLGPERYAVMREKKRGDPMRHRLPQGSGLYSCAACELPLFRSEDRYESGSLWPSFTRVVSPKNVHYLEDYELSFKRYEVLCRRCDGHIGHVFNDGPGPKGLRYTVSSLALVFEKRNFLSHFFSRFWPLPLSEEEFER